MAVGLDYEVNAAFTKIVKCNQDTTEPDASWNNKSSNNLETAAEELCLVIGELESLRVASWTTSAGPSISSATWDNRRRSITSTQFGL